MLKNISVTRNADLTFHFSKKKLKIHKNTKQHWWWWCDECIV